MEAAMPVDEAMIAEVRQANAAYLAGYEHRLAAEIVAMLPEAPDEALRVLAVVHAMLDVTLPPRQPPPPAAA
jgi:hypothetical protein